MNVAVITLNQMDSLLVAQMFPGMMYFPIIILSLLIGTLLGLAAVLASLLRKRKHATTLSYSCIGLASLCTLACLVLIGDALTLRGYAASLFPIPFGLIALLINLIQRGKPPFRKYQYPLFVPLSMIAVLALMVGMWLAVKP